MQTTILLTFVCVPCSTEIDPNGTAQLMNLETTMSEELIRSYFNDSPGPSRFAIAGRPARTGMIRRYYLTRSHYVPVLPRLKPVNSPTESRSSPDWLRAPVVAGYAPVEPRLKPATVTAELRRATATPRLTPIVADNALVEPR
ncbi:hypothetical protein DPMN_152613 [Dreissena polymorpha]|uniref:Uncharacterized protein n=1 Tax=Dreissena polymorpha TaxID=45954 RepID=A0A9D4J7H8_DREPO|nr:hypothetical protein DPMN_152613 [Dreissena polymorpha]